MVKSSDARERARYAAIMRGLSILVAWLWAAPALAQTVSLDTALTVPEQATCLTHEALVEHTAAWLGVASIDARQTILIELGEGERLGVGFVLLQAGEARARRRFARLPEACADRRAALSLALAIALDASVLDRLGQEPRSAPEPAVTPVPSPAPSPAVTPVPSPPPRPITPPREPPALGVRVALDAGIDAGALPRWSPTGGFDLAVYRPGWELRLRLGATPRRSSALLGGQVQAELVQGGLDICLDRPAASVELSGCVGPRVGRLWARGEGFATSRTTHRPWVAAVATVQARWPRDSVVSLRVGAEGRLLVLRPVLRVRAPEGEVLRRHEAAPVGFAATAGLVVALR